MSGSSKVDDGFVSVGAALSFVEGEFGGPVTETDTELSILGNTITDLVDPNPERLSLTILNLGSNAFYVSFDNKPSATRGVLISASGGYLSMTVRDDQLLQCRGWYGIAPAGPTDVYIIETKRYALTAPSVEQQSESNQYGVTGPIG